VQVVVEDILPAGFASKIFHKPWGRRVAFNFFF